MLPPRRLALYLCLFSLNHVLSQNLVPNPSFEELSQCPVDTFASVSLAIPWQPINTSDVFNACAQGFSWRVPNYSGNGYLEARTGVGFAAVRGYSNNITVTPKEFIYTPLLDSMIANKPYYVSFYVAAYTDYFGTEYVYTNSIGLSAKVGEYLNIVPGTPQETYVIVEHMGPVINESVWRKVSGCYIAAGGEDYIALGDFRRASSVIVDTGLDLETDFVSNYLFLDDISIHLFDPLPDTLILCAGEPLTLDASFLDAGYRWNTGADSPSITINESGYYSVAAIMDNCELQDEVYVIDPMEGLGLPAEINICEGETTVLNAIAGFNSYQWSTGSNRQSILITQPGDYSLTVTNVCNENFEDQTQVDVNSCECNIYVPNAISPNSDGVNDRLEIFPFCEFPLTILSFKVFDRWGGLVYELTGDQNIQWDGSFRNRPLPNGVYIWVLDYEFVQDGTVKKQQESGDLHLLR